MNEDLMHDEHGGGNHRDEPHDTIIMITITARSTTRVRCGGTRRGCCAVSRWGLGARSSCGC